jgi:hypothetical protein
MAIDINNIARKPEIWLAGDVVNLDGVAGKVNDRVDNAIHTPPSSTTTIESVTLFDQEDILTFVNSVRVTMTTSLREPSYYREGKGVLSDQTYEGAPDNDDNKINEDAEIWYTYNGTDPVQDKCYLYNFASTGFVLRNSPTGSELITLKARTFYRGQQSRIAIATFKIAQNSGDRAFYQTPR